MINLKYDDVIRLRCGQQISRDFIVKMKPIVRALDFGTLGL